MFCLHDCDLKHPSANYSLRITFSWGFYGHHQKKRSFKSVKCSGQQQECIPFTPV